MMLAMVFTGVLSSGDAFSNFGSTPVLLTFGMIVIIDAIIDSGAIVQFEHVLQHMTRRGEKLFLVLVFLSAGIISMFTNNSALVAMFMPFIASTARSTGGKIKKKHLYLPLAMGGLIGGTGSLAGSTAPLLANEVLEITGQKQFSFFTTAPVSLSILAVVALCYWFFLYDLTVKWFDFEEARDDGKPIAEIPLNKRNAVISLTVFIASVVLFIIQPFGWDLGLIAISGAVIVITMGCVDVKTELSNMMWPALVTLGAALAMATPVATTTITMVQVAGYRFKDYLRAGGLVGIIGLLTAWVAIVLIYGLL